MKALLDTHAFLWWITDSALLPPHIRELIADGDNVLLLSAASCWEMAIKARLGKLTLPAHPDVYLAEQISANGIQSLPVLASHALQVFHLPDHHRDPFDRMIIAQAQLENLPIITSDPLFSKYKVKTIWGKR